jgi:hypothetical protein
MSKATSGDLQMFGMSTDDIREQYMNSLTAEFCGLEMVVAGILSDAQELLVMDRKDESRKLMNIAKFILFEMMDKKETV